MPLHIQPLSLIKACEVNIARNIDKHYAPGFQEKSRNANYAHVIGPFDYLTSKLSQDIINTLVELKLLKRHHLFLLINERMENLDLHVCKFVSNKDNVVNIVAHRCHRLTQLNLCMLSQVSARTLSDIVEKLPMLKVLNLHQTKCSDQVLSRIGSCCRDLRELNLSGCSVTNMGIMSLCVTFNRSEPKCPRLSKLDISSTNVTPEGAQLVLQNLKLMACLVYYDVVGVLEKAHEQTFIPGQAIPPSETYNLRYISEYGSVQVGKLSLTGVQILVSYCPLLTEFICFNGITNEQMLCLSSLQHLTALHLADMNQQMTFCEGLLPFLQVRGHMLLQLHLYEVNELNVKLIGLTCPNIVRFSCLIAGYPFAKFSTQPVPGVSADPSLKPFQHLEVVKINMFKTQNNFPAAHLKLLLAHCNKLQEMQFSGNEALDDEVLIDCASRMRDLEVVILELCHGVTAAALDVLLDSDNKLRVLSMKECREVTRRDYERLQRRAARENLALELTWV